MHCGRQIEVLFKLVKVDLRTSGGVLRSGRPEGVRQELWALLCVYQALRTLITRAAAIAGVDPARISFPPVLDAVKGFVRTAFPPELLTKPLCFLIADLPDMLIRERRPHLSYRTRSSTDPGTRRVTRTIVLHQLTPDTA